jgi:hypothetical protein
MTLFSENAENFQRTVQHLCLFIWLTNRPNEILRNVPFIKYVRWQTADFDPSSRTLLIRRLPAVSEKRMNVSETAALSREAREFKLSKILSCSIGLPGLFKISRLLGLLL